MIFPPSNSQPDSDSLGDGEYYVFSQQQGEKIRLGYLSSTWCGSPSVMHMRFCSVEIGKPLFLVISGNGYPDKAQIKTFNFDSRNLKSIDDVYNRALSWLNQMQGELDYSQLDEIADCTIAVIVVNKGVLSAFYSKGDFLNAFFEAFDLFETEN